MLKELQRKAKEVAEGVEDLDFVKVISHTDADGLTSAGIVAHALQRAGVQFQISIVKGFSKELAFQDQAVIFCDMGAGYPEAVNAIKGDVRVLDHHIMGGDFDEHVKVLNPHQFGLDGAKDLSASGVAYLFARAMGDCKDLAGLALTGALGDLQSLENINGAILKEGVDGNAVTVKRGLRVGSGTTSKVLESSIDPYFNLGPEFINSLEPGIAGKETSELSKEELGRLLNELIMQMADSATIVALKDLYGDVLFLEREVIKNVFDMISTLGACGAFDRYGVALSLVLRDPGPLAEAQDLLNKYRMTVHSNIEKVKQDARTHGSIRYVILDKCQSAGIVSTAAIRYIFPDRPLLVINKQEELCKVSARGTRELVDAGMDLSAALGRAAKACGGGGGGHNIASGATIPSGTEEKFIKEVDVVVTGQLS